MDIDTSDPVGAVIGIFVLLIIAYVLIIFLGAVTSFNTTTQCAPYISKVNELNNQLLIKTSENVSTQEQLAKCQNDYNYLVNTQVTKKDIQTILSDVNILDTKVVGLYDRFSSVNNNYYDFQQTVVNNFNLSLALNIVFGFEILSFAFLKNEFMMFAIEWVKKRRKKHEKQE